MNRSWDIPFVKLDTRYRDHRDEIIAAFDSAADTGQFIMGAAVDDLEKKLSALCETEYAVTVGSGFDALFLALKSLGIGPGDEVLTPANSFIATPGAIAATGAKPVFVDVGSDFNLDPAEIEPCINNSTRAILPVHLTGRPVDFEPIAALAEQYKLLVIEDAAQAIGAKYQGKPVGSLGDIGCFSLHPLKNLHVLGDGGFITTDNQEVYEKLLMLRNHGLKNRDDCVVWGYNSRLDAVQAAILLTWMDKLAEWTERRRQIARHYNQALRSFVTVPNIEDQNYSVFHNYIICTPNRDELQKYMDSKGIETKIHYPVPLHLQQPALEQGYVQGQMPVTERLVNEMLSLPIYPELLDEQVETVIETLTSFYA